MGLRDFAKADADRSSEDVELLLDRFKTLLDIPEAVSEGVSFDNDQDITMWADVSRIVLQEDCLDVFEGVKVDLTPRIVAARKVSCNEFAKLGEREFLMFPRFDCIKRYVDLNCGHFPSKC